MCFFKIRDREIAPEESIRGLYKARKTPWHSYGAEDFTKETDQLVYNFNASISFDQKFYKQDIEGSIAHVRMLGKQGILTQEEMQAIVSCLQEILADVESGKLAITSEYEDIHSFVEANLIDRLGDTGKKLHTGRSRNDQVALDMRLYTRQQVLETDELLEQHCCRYCFAL